MFNYYSFLAQKNYRNVKNVCVFFFSVSDGTSDVAALEVPDSDLPTADCDEEEDNSYDSDRWVEKYQTNTPLFRAGSKSYMCKSHASLKS